MGSLCSFTAYHEMAALKKKKVRVGLHCEWPQLGSRVRKMLAHSDIEGTQRLLHCSYGGTLRRWHYKASLLCNSKRCSDQISFCSSTLRTMAVVFIENCVFWQKEWSNPQYSVYLHKWRIVAETALIQTNPNSAESRRSFTRRGEGWFNDGLGPGGDRLDWPRLLGC